MSGINIIQDACNERAAGQSRGSQIILHYTVSHRVSEAKHQILIDPSHLFVFVFAFVFISSVTTIEVKLFRKALGGRERG